MLRALVLAAAPLLAPAAAQDHWTVDDNGPADFVSIAAAVGSALVQDGDVLLVEPGSYGFFATSKALAIIGRAGGALPMVSGLSRIEDADSFTLAGIDLNELLVFRVPGRFAVEDCEIGHTGTVGSWPTFLIEDCAEAVVSNSLLQGKSGDEFFVESPGLWSINSRVALTNCEIHGGEGGDAGFGGFPGQPGVLVDGGSVVVIAGCSISGGNGGTSDPPFEPCSSQGAPAIEVFDSTLWVKGNASHVLDSGEGCPQGDAFAIGGSASHVTVSGVTLEAPAFSPGLISSGGSITEPMPPEPFLTLAGDPAPDATRRLNLYGPAGADTLVLLSVQPLFASLPKLVGGPLWLDPAGQILFLQVTLKGQSLSQNVLLPLPATGDFAGFVVWTQAFVPAAASKWTALNPASLVLRF
jgi:hypothetical protein